VAPLSPREVQARDPRAACGHTAAPREVGARLNSQVRVEPVCRIATMPSPVLLAVLGLAASNVFMTFAWYAHLKNLSGHPWYVAALVSWGIALFEYLLQVPANRIGYGALSLAQLKILQEVITLTVFVPFALIYMRQPLNWNFLWAGLCMVGAVYFMFK
jgi:uncharacterized protein (DUF486 family)